MFVTRYQSSLARGKEIPVFIVLPGNTAVTKKLHIKTYGCQMNVYDSEQMVNVLSPLGFEVTPDSDQADLVILNTCHIREKAAEKVYSELGRLKAVQREKRAAGWTGPEQKLAVAGCVAQAEGDEVFRRAPGVDMVFGPQSYHKLPEMVTRLYEAQTGERVRLIDTDFPVEDKFDALPKPTSNDGPAAFLTVQEGCDKFCTFCVVPYTRGGEYSRPAASIVDEAKAMADLGVKELTLLGQNVNAYHGAGSNGRDVSLAGLIELLADIDGIERLRFTTSHPNDMSDDLFAAFRNQPKLMPYLHLPVQAGSDKVLDAMNRRHTADDYRRIIARLRDNRPDIAISGDFIVGFPGETDQDFADTLRLVTDIGYQSAYSFKYSMRPGTPGAALGDQVPEAVKSERLAMLQTLLNEQQLAFNQASVGKTMDVLMERRGRQPGQLLGRSPYMQSIHVEAPQRLLSEIVSVKITEAKANSIAGEVALIAEAA